MPAQRIAAYLFIALAVFITAIPIAYLVFGSLWSTSPGLPGELTSANYAEVFSDPSTPGVVATSIAYSLGAAIFATSAGFLLAFLVHRTDAPLRRFMTISILVTLAVPFFIEDISWTYLLNPTNGLFNLGFKALTGFPIFDVYSIWGLIVVMGVDLTPLSYLMMTASLSLMDPLFAESSRVSGAGLGTTIRRIIIPVLRPALLSTLMLDFIISMEAFDAPAIIGIPGRVYVLTTSIYRAIVGQVPPNYGVATAYGVLLITFTLAAVALYLRYTRQAMRYETFGSRAGRPKLIPLGRMKWFAALFFLAYAFLYPVPVIATIALASVHLFWNPNFLLTGFTLSNFSDFLSTTNALPSMLNSVVVGISASAVAVLLAFGIGYARVRASAPGARIAEVVVTIPLALPTLVLGVALLWALVFSPLPIYGTIWALSFAYVVKYLPVVLRLLSGPLIQLQKDFEEASRVAGASPLRTVRSIVLPLLRPGLVISAVYVFLVSVKDLGAAVILVTQKSQLLSAVIFQFWSAGEFPIAAAAGALYILVLAFVLLVAIFLFKANPTALVAPEGRRAAPETSPRKRPE